MDYYKRKQRELKIKNKKLDFIKKMQYLKEKEVEFIYLMVYNNNLSREKCYLIAKGELSNAKLSPRELIKKILKEKGKYCILLHNHPSGETDPTEDDINITINTIKILSVIEVKLIDHIIMGEKTYYSILERKELNYENKKDRRNLKKLGNIGSFVRRIRYRKNHNVRANWKTSLGNRL